MCSRLGSCALYSFCRPSALYTSEAPCILHSLPPHAPRVPPLPHPLYFRDSLELSPPSPSCQGLWCVPHSRFPLLSPLCQELCVHSHSFPYQGPPFHHHSRFSVCPCYSFHSILVSPVLSPCQRFCMIPDFSLCQDSVCLSFLPHLHHGSPLSPNPHTTGEYRYYLSSF